MLDLCEGLFDGVQVGAVRRQEEELGADGTDGAADGLAFVAAEIVEHDNIARLKGWDEELLDIGAELLPIDRPLKRQ